MTRRSAVKGDAGRAGQVGPQNLDEPSHHAGGRPCLHKRAETHGQAEDRAVAALTPSPYGSHLMRHMMKRRLEDAGLPDLFSPHSFRVTVVTDLLNQNIPLEDVQYLAGHSSPTTTRVYDRRRRRVTQIERISI